MKGRFAMSTKTKKAKTAGGSGFLVWGIPPQLKTDFKTECARRGVSMRKVVIAMMGDYTAKAKSNA